MQNAPDIDYMPWVQAPSLSFLALFPSHSHPSPVAAPSLHPDGGEERSVCVNRMNRNIRRVSTTLHECWENYSILYIKHKGGRHGTASPVSVWISDFGLIHFPRKKWDLGEILYFYLHLPDRQLLFPFCIWVLASADLTLVPQLERAFFHFHQVKAGAQMAPTITSFPAVTTYLVLAWLQQYMASNAQSVGEFLYLRLNWLFG